ncbi:MAG TPA: hypothetical protein VMT45_08045 [Thermoanaerobaculaceae bacterium]|nr:hypothetical protein [Thermoanaerobaculaceae bacterium]
MADKPLGEDGYYMLTIAWNLAGGKGMSAGPTQNVTGTQPLATLLYGALAWIVRCLGGDHWVFLRAVIILGTFLLVAFGVVVGKVAAALTAKEERSREAFAVAFTLAAGSFYLFRTFTYGLETGIYLLLLASCVLLSLRLPVGGACSIRQALVLGLLVGLTGTARIDFGVPFAVFAASALVQRRVRISRLVLTGVTALALVLPWLAWVKTVSGFWIPTSGLAESSLVTWARVPDRLWALVGAVVQQWLPPLYTAGRPFLTAVGLVSIPTLAAIGSRAVGGGAFEGPRLTVLLYWLAGTLVLSATYCLLFWSTHFYVRYTAPLTVITIPLTACWVAAIARRQRRTLAMVLATVMLLFALSAYRSLHSGRIGNTHALAAAYINEHLRGARVGAFQSGVIGYFNENVVNLDGKINRAALEAAGGGRLGGYIDEQRIDALIDWPEVIHGALGEDYLRGWSSCRWPVPAGASVCLERAGARQTAPADELQRAP